MMRWTAPSQPLACVMGDMDLVRPLGLAGIRCAVVASPGSMPEYSRFTKVMIPWPDEEIADGADALLDCLLRFAMRQAEQPVLFYEQDAQLLFVSRNRGALAKAFRFAIPDPMLVEDLVDKARFQALAKRLNLPVPKASRVRPAPGWAAPEFDLRFPVVIKPLWRRQTWAEAAKVIQIDTPQMLRDAWPHWIQHDVDLLVQEMIPGPENCIESYHVYVDADGRIAGEFTGRKIRTFPIAHGHSTALTVTDTADVAALGRSLVGVLGLRGLAKFDFKRDPEGRLHLLEVNPRFTLWHHLGALAGVNLPALVYADLAGLPRPAAELRRTGVCWCRFTEDWHAARESGISFRTWLPWALGCEANSLAWDDPMPFLHALWRTVSDRLTAHLPAMPLHRRAARSMAPQ